jgi:hypothetical protein
MELTDLTEQDKQEIQDFLPDLNVLLKTFVDLEGQMTTEQGKAFCEEFSNKAVPFLKSMKAEILVALDLI